jgi:hypothetical protein
VSKLVVIAVLGLAALAAADAFRASPRERTVANQELNLAQPVTVHRATSGLIAVGSFTRKRVLKNGREYLSSEEVDGAFPAGLESVPFDIAYVASASDGTVALGIYGFPYGGPASSVIELWRGHSLLSVFRVPSGAFAGGIGFAEEGRLVATLSSDGLLVHLFTRSGKPAGRQPATSW